MAQQKHTSAVDQIGVGAQIEVKVASHATAAEHSYATVVAIWHVPRVLKSLPCTFQKLAVLRIHDRGVLGGQTKEFCIEMVELIEPRRKRHVVTVPQQARRHSCLGQFVIGQAADRRYTVPQVSPVFRQRCRPWQVGGHADNGDVCIRDRVWCGCFFRHGRTLFPAYGQYYINMIKVGRAAAWQPYSLVKPLSCIIAPRVRRPHRN